MNESKIHFQTNAVSVNTEIFPLTFTRSGVFDSCTDGNSFIFSSLVLCPYGKMMMNDVTHDNYNMDELFFSLFADSHRVSL